MDGNLTGTGRKAVRVTGFCPRGVGCETEGKLGVGAGPGGAGAGRGKRWRRELVMDSLRKQGSGAGRQQ